MGKLNLRVLKNLPEIGNIGRKQKLKIRRPKWHDRSCDDLSRDIRKSAKLLKIYPNNSYLRTHIQLETKKYKKLLKTKHKDFINGLFNELDSMHKCNPKGYMNLVKSLRDGSFDSKKNDDSSFIKPEKWREHFSSLLAPKIEETESEIFFKTPSVV